MSAQENSCSPATLLAPGSLGFRGSWAIPLKNHLVIEHVVSELYAPVYRFALVLAESETEAADLTQETFLILCRQYEQVQEPDKVRSWLFTTLRRLFFRTLRKRHAYPEVKLNAQHQVPTVDPAGPRSVDTGTILSALSELEEDQRTVLELFYIADLSYKEISSTLKIPIGTVMSRLARAKERLRSALTEISSPERPANARKSQRTFAV
jgi:RNA polymerase sigma-70 factor, ECF subfamily